MEEFDPRRASLDLVTAFVSNNKLSAAELPALLGDVFAAVSKLDSSTAEAVNGKVAETPVAKAEPVSKETAAASEPPPPQKTAPQKTSPSKTRARGPAKAGPAVSVEETTRDPDFIVSLITGEKFKTLKRHLKKHGLTEAEYRTRFGLPDDYPMVSASYSETRRNIARNILHAPKAEAAAAADEVSAPAADETPAAPKGKRASKAPAAKTGKRPARAAEAKADEAPVEEAAAVEAAPEAEAKAAPEAETAAQEAPAEETATAEQPQEKPARKRQRRARPASSSEAEASGEAADAGSRKPARRKSAAKPAAEATSDAEADKPGRGRRTKLSAVFG